MIMHLGLVFYLLALILFLFAWIGAQLLPNPIAGGLFCLTLGLLLETVPVPWRRGA
jgi:hypothetical protein